MADAKTLTVPSFQEPTFWNRDTLVQLQIWSWFGAIPLHLATAAAAGAGIITGTGLAATILYGIAAVLPFIGSVSGGFDGKARMEHEQLNGKQVHEPSFFNKSMGTASFVAGLLAAIPITLAFGGVMTPLGLSVLAAVELTGAIIGGFVGKAKMEREYEQAKEYVAQHGNFNPQRGHAPEQKLEHAYTVTPEESRHLQTKLDAGKRSHAEAVTEQQAAAAEMVR